jgi:hypothetical protein
VTDQLTQRLHAEAEQLPASGFLPAEVRQRAEHRRRIQRRVGGALVSAGVVVVAVAVAVNLGSEGRSTPAPASTSSTSPTATASHRVAEPAVSFCRDAVGDSIGGPDLTLVSLDRPAWPFIDFNWDGKLPQTGSVEALFTATSADRQSSRQLGVDISDGQVVSQYVRDPQTGDLQELNFNAFTDTKVNGVRQRAVGLSAHGLGASWRPAATSPLGDGWTWTASILIDQRPIDTCNANHG